MNRDLLGKGYNLLSKQDWGGLSQYLRETFKLQMVSGVPQISCGCDIEILHQLAFFVEASLHHNKPTEESFHTFLIELFRALRNSVTSPEAQKYFINNKEFLLDLNTTVNIIFKSCTTEAEVAKTLKPFLQFLANLTIACNKNAGNLYKSFEKEIHKCLSLGILESIAFMYNVFLRCDHRPENWVYKKIVNMYTTQNYEYIEFILELFLQHPEFWIVYPSFDLQNRIKVLTLIRQLQVAGRLRKLPTSTLKHFVKQFSNCGNIIFETVTDKSDSDGPYEISLLLEVMCSLASNEDYLKVLQDKELLINAGAVLINFHRLGKQSDNCFTSVQKLADIKEPSDVIKEHPAFGFKVGLIRLIGNLCWKNKKMQDLVREAELIPVILDCCNIDARNPLIMQWVIFSIRNLCEGNPQNQKLIARMHNKGLVTSAALEEMGITLQNDGDMQLKIVPLNDLRKC